MFLRHDVGDVLIRNGAFVQIDQSRAFPVAVVFKGSASKPFEILETGFEGQDHTKTREVRNGFVDRKDVVDLDPAVRENGITVLVPDSPVRSSAGAQMLEGERDASVFVASRFGRHGFDG